jgi:hypothetical protein
MCGHRNVDEIFSTLAYIFCSYQQQYQFLGRPPSTFWWVSHRNCMCRSCAGSLGGRRSGVGVATKRFLSRLISRRPVRDPSPVTFARIKRRGSWSRPGYQNQRHYYRPRRRHSDHGDLSSLIAKVWRINPRKKQQLTHCYTRANIPTLNGDGFTDAVRSGRRKSRLDGQRARRDTRGTTEYVPRV